MPVFIIAEIGINHNGSMIIAKRLIEEASNMGCNAVKFQKRDVDEVYSRRFLDSPRDSQWGETQRAQKEGLEFGFDQYEEIDRYCREKNIEWLASAWDLESQRFMRQFDLKYNKVASAMIVYEKLLEMIAEEKKHTFISTGMSTEVQISRAVQIFEDVGCSYELMHCVSTYPMDVSDANLNRMNTLKDKFGCNVGYSGHEVGLVTSFAAVAMGASSLERHITLDRAMYGSDQAASVEVEGFARLVRGVRVIEASFGSGKMLIGEEEKIIANKLREHIPV